MFGSASQLKAGLFGRGSSITRHASRIAESVTEFLDEVSENPQDLFLPRLSGAKAHLLRRSGKLVRPLVIWLLGRSLEVSGPRLVPYALSIELLHNASLLHDDVIDRSLLRRHRPTANALYNNTLPVLAGDALLASSISQIAGTGDVPAMKALAAAIQDLITGEALQYELTGELHDNVQLCIEIAKLKTGVLFSLGTWLPAHLAELPADEQEAFALIGSSSGVSFQLVDDILDFDAGKTGKPKLADWQEAKTNAVTATLLQLHPGLRRPLHRVFAAEPDSRAKLGEQLLEEEIPVAVIDEAIGRVRELAQDYAALADHHAHSVPDNEAGRQFEKLRAYLLRRAA